MVASDWSDEFTLHLDEDHQFYYYSYYAGSDYCPQDIEVSSSIVVCGKDLLC
jgi:hypothetical protein